MAELRWILLVAGLALIAGLYAWGVRARKRSAAPQPERITRVEAARTVSTAAPGAAASRVEPQVSMDAEPTPDDLPVLDADLDEPAIRRSPLQRREPRIESAPPGGLAQATPTEVHAARAQDERKATPTAQKIVAVRIAATPPAMFDGSELLAAIRAEGFEFGRYQIFHRMDADSGRPVCSLASLREPGTFDPDAMAGTEFRGIALFAVLPGPLPAQQTLDELLAAARLLAGRLEGALQDERGAALSIQRIAHLREEIADFERGRLTPHGR